MRIGIDGYNLALTHGTGVATYGFVLADTLRAMGHEVIGVFGVDTGADPATREVILFDRLGRGPQPPASRKQAARADRRRLRAAMHPWRRHRLYEVPLTGRVETVALAERLPQLDRIVSAGDLFEIAHRHFGLFGRFLKITMPDPPEIMHWTYPVPLRMVGARNIYTVHDLVPLKLPYATLDNKDVYRRLIGRCVAEADRICTVSEVSMRDIVEQYPSAGGKTINTYQASPMRVGDDPASAVEDADMIEGIFGLKRDGYFLFYGNIEPKKNLGRLIEAFLAIRSPHPLVIVGSSGWQSEGELRLLPAPGSAAVDRVVRFDYLPRTLLRRLIRGARAVTFPSLYEGFGLPLLEAMELGAPTLTSDTGALPEIAGNMTVAVSPYDVKSIASGLARLDEDADLRDELRSGGPARAASFSRRAYLERLKLLYERAA